MAAPPVGHSFIIQIPEAAKKFICCWIMRYKMPLDISEGLLLQHNGAQVQTRIEKIFLWQ